MKHTMHAAAPRMATAATARVVCPAGISSGRTAFSGARVLGAKRTATIAPAAAAAAAARSTALRRAPATTVVARAGGFPSRGGGGGFGGGAAGGYRRGGEPSIGDRVLAAVPFLLPFLDAFAYGRFLFFTYPALAAAVRPAAPLLRLYHSVPLAPLVAFFGIYLGIVNNARLPRFVRFSAMQAVLLDILLVLPRLLEQLVAPPSAPGAALQAYVAAQNGIWLAVAAAVAFGMAGALLGREARIPFIADAAEQQVR